jgi:hypothetical protein
VFESGARRITVNFDGSFRACTVDVVYGKERGVPGIIMHTAFDGTHREETHFQATLRLSTYKVSDQNCTITDGNIFGGNSD